MLELAATGLTLLLCACATTRSTTTDSSSSAREDSRASVVTHSDVTRTGGAVDSVTVVEEYLPAGVSSNGRTAASDAADLGSSPSAPTIGAESSNGRTPAFEAGDRGSSPRSATIFRRTTTRTHVAPVEAHAVTDARSLAETHAQATAIARTEEQRSVRVGPSWLGYGALAFGGVLALLVGVWLWRR